MESRKRPLVRPIQTGSTGIRPHERRSSRARSVPLPSPLRCSSSTSELPFGTESPYQAAQRCFPKTPYPHHGRKEAGLASRRLTRNQLKIYLARLDSLQANSVFSPRIENGPKTSPLDNRVSRLMSFQRYRDALWRCGWQRLSHDNDADVFVNAVAIRDMAVMDNDFQTPSHAQSVRVVIHSEGRCPVGLTRQFDMNHLRATVPEASPSPRSAGFDKEALLSAVLQQAAKSPGSMPVSNAFRNGISNPEESAAGSLLEQTPSLGLPIHLQYARASLPVLASIMMSPQIRHGDTIDLPIPFPEAWPETVAFAYTGEEELMTELVRKNMCYLGGRP